MASRRAAAVLIGLLLGTVMLGRPAVAQNDSHAGYYYPIPQSSEVYHARARTLAEADRSLRIGFVTGITNQLLSRPYAPTMAMFAKGDDAQKLIIVALEEGRISTLYRARAVFAELTSVARVMPIFKELGVQEWFTFFDLAKLLGFQQITISDGDRFAHQVTID
ncbi:MAG: molybdopterin-guanine dinucleotide biosynthesis protein A [Kiloniellales bacterium]